MFWAAWLLFTGVPVRCVVLCVRCPGPPSSCSPVCPLGALLCVCGVLGHLAPGHQCARAVCCVASAVSWTTWLLFTGAPAWCVALRVRCPGPPGFCSQVCPLGMLCCFSGVLDHLTPVHQCARSVCCFACAVSWATRLLLTGVPAQFVVLCLQCPGPLGSCSPVRPLGALTCVCVVLGNVAPVHRCACSVCCAACALSLAPWLLFTGVNPPCVVLRVRCPGPLGSCSPLCSIGVLCCVCGVLGHLAPVHRCARSICSVACVVSWATWLLFTGVPARCVVLRVRHPCPLALVHRCARSVCCVGFAVSWATWLLFTGVLARCVVLWVACAVLHVRGVAAGRTLVHPDGGFFVAGRGWVCCRARTCPTGRRLALLGTFSRAMVRCVLGALSGFAAPGGRCCLAPVRVPWLWPAACLSGVPRGPPCCAAPRPFWSLFVLRLASPTPWCLFPPRWSTAGTLGPAPS